MNLCMCIQRTVHACITRSPTVLHFCLEKLKCFFLNTHKVLGYSCHVSFYTREGNEPSALAISVQRITESQQTFVKLCKSFKHSKLLQCTKAAIIQSFLKTGLLTVLLSGETHTQGPEHQSPCSTHSC